MSLRLNDAVLFLDEECNEIEGVFVEYVVPPENEDGSITLAQAKLTVDGEKLLVAIERIKRADVAYLFEYELIKQQKNSIENNQE